MSTVWVLSDKQRAAIIGALLQQATFAKSDARNYELARSARDAYHDKAAELEQLLGLCENDQLPGEQYDEEQEERLGAELALVLGCERRREGGWHTDWGWKTGKGLLRMLRALFLELEAGRIRESLQRAYKGGA
jgi:hypothetical protein